MNGICSRDDWHSHSCVVGLILDMFMLLSGLRRASINEI